MGPPTLRYQGNVDGPWYVVSLREFLLLTAPSGLLCGKWDFSSPFSRRCSHGYQVQVKNSSIAALSSLFEPVDDEPEDDEEEDFDLPEPTPEIMMKMFANLEEHGLR